MSDDLLPYFLEEGRELVERLGQALADLARGEQPVAAVEEAFRAAHTLKGSAALFDMAELEDMLHAAESELETGRRAGGALKSSQLAALSDGVGEIERWLEAIEAEGQAPQSRRTAAAKLATRLRTSAPAVAAAEAAPDSVDAPQNAAAFAARTVRVEAAALDAASDLLDQLLVAKNALAHETAKALGERAEAAAGVAGAQLALDRAAATLHEAVGRLRLAPLRRLFAPMPRQVREMAETLGKSATLTVSGEDVALDKAIMDGLYEPLLHILRNAVDHGLEAPAQRRTAGKPDEGAIRLAATPRGGAVMIEVSDDGAGLDYARIRAVAAQRGLLSAQAADALSDADAADLVFRPGFSTAREVTGLSGRGVGLDAVRAALARIGGRVEFVNRPGAGSTVRMTAPLRAVLAQVAVLCVGEERFGVVLPSIREVLRVRASQVTAVRSGEAIVVGDEAIPLLHLGELVGGVKSRCDPLTVVIIEAPEGRVGVAVDRIGEILRSPVQTAPLLLAELKAVAGSLLQPDGRVLLLLDLAALTA